ncbi:hypothetical protein [Aliikangiella coralliicola]|uniref:Uncharacterized protein n=1 Tax=Aliikangiella coralliicola TaxID=2592383 RepID=A0A545U4F3_9GAMM|nr:hypothetical protein [Aliikangiella coralliicola]TQV84360.1 hypothetical protein FLL46_22305 [Aliikangiella coralliicola]
MANKPTITQLDTARQSQDTSLEKQLKREAQELPCSVDDDLRSSLFHQLKQQNVSEQTSDKPTRKMHFALAASVVFSLLALSVYFNSGQLQKPSPGVATQSEITAPVDSQATNLRTTKEPSIEELLFRVNNEQKLASQQLENEYKAILSDMDKIKRRIVAL